MRDLRLLRILIVLAGLMGADGVILAREYVEMWLANLSAAGETLREIFAQTR